MTLFGFTSRQSLKVGSCGQVSPLPQRGLLQPAPPLFSWGWLMCVSPHSALLSLGAKEPSEAVNLTLEEYGLCLGASGVHFDLLRPVWPGCYHPGQPVSQLLWLGVVIHFCVSVWLGHGA